MRKEPYREGEHYAIDSDTGCWVWLKALDKAGYGHTRSRAAHRNLSGFSRWRNGTHASGWVGSPA
jgi:hypothetical protein